MTSECVSHDQYVPGLVCKQTDLTADCFYIHAHSLQVTKPIDAHLITIGLH